MTLRLLSVLPLSLVVGCLAAPREVETTIDLGPQKVEIDVRLKDIRTSAGNDLNQLRTFGGFVRWDPKWVEDTPWAPAPTRFEYLADAGRLDLAMHGTMSRADFDTCARAASDAGVCNDFPVGLGMAGYSVRPEILNAKSLIIDPKAKSTWPADAGRLAYSVILSPKEELFIKNGPSLQRGFELYATPLAPQTLKQIDATDEVFLRGSAADWLKELTALEACTQEPWCRFRQEAVHRDQLGLVYSYLRPRPEAGDGLAQSPVFDNYLGLPFPLLVPKDTLPLIDELRMRVRYDSQLDNYRILGWVTTDASPWSPVCRPDTMKKPSIKDFCARLGVRAKK